jgi:transposase-like protein
MKVNGHWVVGGVDNTPEKNVFAVVVNNRNATTLLNVIIDWVIPGSIIHTDCWKGYRSADLQNAGMAHDTVNHTYTYVDPISGVHTQCIEGTWSAMKRGSSFPNGQRTKLAINRNLMMYIWRKKNKTNLLKRFLLILQTFRYDEDDINEQEDAYSSDEDVEDDENGDD